MSLWRRLRNLSPGRRRAIESEVREELDALRGMAEPGELGNLTLAAENARAEWSLPVVEHTARDLKMAFRSLRNNPGYSLVCVLTLAVAIGANTAIFSVLDAAVLRPLPYPDADRLVFVWEKITSMPFPVGPRIEVSRIVYQQLRQQRAVFDDVAAFSEAPLNEAGVARPRTISTGFASDNLFGLLGARATSGELFQPKGIDQVAVLSDAYFEKRFHRDPAAIGRAITLGREDYTVIGILPPRFHLPAIYEGGEQKKPEVWLPLSRLWYRAADDTAFSLYVMARLQDGVSLDQARIAVSALQDRLHKSDEARYPASQASVFPAAVEDHFASIDIALYVLLGATAILLLIGCANLANLTLARAARRAREISIRRALGASRGRIVAQLLTESSLLSIAGAGAGILLAQALVKSVLRLPTLMNRPEDIELNGAVFLFAAAVSVLTTLLFGLAPAITVSKTGLNESLKSRGGGGASASMAHGRSVLTTVEVALAVVLLCGSVVVIRSAVKLFQTGMGFSLRNLAVADISLPESRYPDGSSRMRFYDALLARARAIPGVAIATVSTTLPLKGINFATFAIAGAPASPPGESLSTDVAEVGRGYFRVMGLPILQGRDFTESDFHGSQKQGGGVVIINRAFAEKFFPGRNPLDQHLLLGDNRPLEIVGVAENFLVLGGLEDPRPQFFWARTEAPNALLLLRTTVTPESLADAIRAALLADDPELPVTNVESMEHVMREAASDPEKAIVLMSVFAVLAWSLAMVGMYGVLTNLVAARTRELGIRMALGATAGAMARMVAWQSLKPLVAGMVLGLSGSLAMSRVLRSLSQGVVTADPLMLAGVALAVFLVAPMAVWGPVRRATSAECTVALREE